MHELTVHEHVSHSRARSRRRHLVLIAGNDQRRRMNAIVVLGAKAITGREVLEIDVVAHPFQ